MVFSQPVIGFESGDVSLSSGTAAVMQIDATTYNVAVSGMADGVLTATVPGDIARNALSIGNNPSTSTVTTMTAVTPLPPAAR